MNLLEQNSKIYNIYQTSFSTVWCITLTEPNKRNVMVEKISSATGYLHNQGGFLIVLSRLPQRRDQRRADNRAGRQWDNRGYAVHEEFDK